MNVRAVAFAFASVLVSGTLSGAIGCATDGDSDQAKDAGGHYEIGLSLVHEAEKASAAGDQQTQDLKYREALRELLDAEKTNAMAPEAHYLLGYVYFIGFHRHAEATANLQKAIEKRKEQKQEEYPEAENLLGFVLLDQNKPKDAIAYFEKARTNLLYATPYFSEQGMGEAYFKMGRQDEAVQHFQRALVAQPDLCGAYVKLAEVEVARGDEVRVQKALSDFLERCDSERLRPSTGPRLLAPGYLQMGQSKLRTGDREGAASAFRTCIERFPEQPVARECDSALRALESN
jgi:tetratricopeptide (TPR) repeat protein